MSSPEAEADYAKKFAVLYQWAKSPVRVVEQSVRIRANIKVSFS